MQQSKLIDPWKIEEVRKYLARRFPGARFDDYPRAGGTAYLFVVTAAGIGKRVTRHNLVVTRQFFDRFPEHSSLKSALESGDVAHSMERAGERSIELY
jgi:hypothetical protein